MQVSRREIKIVPEPYVEIIGRQAVDREAVQRVLARNGHNGWNSDSEIPAQVLVEFAGRKCYQSFLRMRPGGNAAYIRNLIEKAHGSCAEHAVWTISIEGVSRTLSHELLRHRAGLSPSELSQRFVDCADVGMVLPPAMLEEYLAQVTASDDIRAWIEKRAADLDEYAEETEKQLANAPAELSGTDKRKWARQAARNCLPNCAETKLVITVNARCLRNIIEQRASRHADVEIRRFANVLYDRMIVEAPAIFFDYVCEDLPDGTREITTKNRKV